MREEPWRRNRRIRNSGRRRGRGNREQQRQRRERQRQHQPRKRQRREPEREADIEDFSPWWRRNRAGAPRGGKTAGTPRAGLLWRRRRRDSSGSSVSGTAAHRSRAPRQRGPQPGSLTKRQEQRQRRIMPASLQTNINRANPEILHLIPVSTQNPGQGVAI